MEVAVIGGGPAGLRVAKETAEAGFDTIVLEKDRKIGRPVQCAGLVSPRVISMTGTESVVKEGYKAQIHPPKGEPLVLESEEPRAYIIDRGDFDRRMAMKAVACGARLELGADVIDTTSYNGKREITYRKGGRKNKIDVDLVIGADGPTSLIRRKAGFPGPEEMLVGVQSIIAKEAKDIHIFLGKDISPDFFGWELPHPSGTLVGVASNDGDAYGHLKRLIDKRKFGDKIIGYSAGTIPLGRVENSVKDGVMLVGDAACQVKPLSGGGLFPGLRSADICSEIAIDSLENRDTSEENLQEYHKRWQKDIGTEISKGMWMRKIFKDISDEELSKMIHSLKDEKVKRVVESVGDIDYPSTLAKPVLKASPKLIKFAGPMIKNIFQPWE
ncbi:MAG: NAD(P)/FAD-dependent oxidoreductase [Candidatus Saliniplasma sp.]